MFVLCCDEYDDCGKNVFHVSMEIYWMLKVLPVLKYASCCEGVWWS
jgi:hypothetical protein